jgi:hypothetical protein
MMSFSVVSWWSFLCVVAALNVAAWGISALSVYRRQPLMSTQAYAVRRVQLVLSAVYVFGCAFRSVLPVYDVPRLCLFDSWLSSVVVGRSVATLAELAFVAQWAVLLREVSRATGSEFAKVSSLLVVPLIAIAETCSWYSVLTTSNIGHVIEESLWGFCAALMLASLITIAPRCGDKLRRALTLWCVVGLAYVGFMLLVDVPMYWSRWLADQASGRQYLSIAQGLFDVSHRWTTSYRWSDWQHEVAWMSLYFSVAVWFSISLIHAPLPKTLRPTERTNTRIGAAPSVTA